MVALLYVPTGENAPGLVVKFHWVKPWYRPAFRVLSFGCETILQGEGHLPLGHIFMAARLIPRNMPRKIAVVRGLVRTPKDAHGKLALCLQGLGELLRMRVNVYD